MKKMAEEEIKFIIRRIYTKDVSFESPLSPAVFDDTNLSPKISFNLNSKIEKRNENNFEIVLDINVKAQTSDKTVYLAEIKQAGLFELEGGSDQLKQRFLHVNCPEAIFPYARENLSNLIQKGGFPPLFLSPIDFQTLYHQELEKRKN